MTFCAKFTALTALLLAFQINGAFSQKIEKKGLIAPTSIPEARDAYNKGYENFEKGNFKKAVKNYKEAIAIDTNYIDAYDNLGLTFRQMGELDSAECYYKKSIAKYPEGLLPRINLGQVYMSKRDFASAYDTYKGVTVIDSTEAEGYFGMARTFMVRKEFDSVIEYAKIALRIYQQKSHPYASDALFLIGVSYYSKNDKENAKKYLQDAVDMGANVPQDMRNELGIKRK